MGEAEQIHNFFNRSKDRAILVVEDNLVNQRLVEVLLESLPYKLDFANNGNDAVAKVSAKNYALILMDIQMPGMDGFEAARYIKLTLNKNIPIIGLTADVGSDNIEKCKEAGMVDFLGKPFSQDALIGIVEKWIGS